MMETDSTETVRTPSPLIHDLGVRGFCRMRNFHFYLSAGASTSLSCDRAKLYSITNSLNYREQCDGIGADGADSKTGRFPVCIELPPFPLRFEPRWRQKRLKKVAIRLRQPLSRDPIGSKSDSRWIHQSPVFQQFGQKSC